MADVASCRGGKEKPEGHYAAAGEGGRPKKDETVTHCSKKDGIACEGGREGERSRRK